MNKSVLVDVNKEIEVQTMCPNNLKCFFILFLLHFVFDFVDHDYLWINPFQVTPRQLKNYSSLCACDDLWSSFYIAYIQ